jgi:hypothetical protein
LIYALRADAAALKDMLVATIAQRHPDKPDIAPEQRGFPQGITKQFMRAYR